MAVTSFFTSAILISLLVFLRRAEINRGRRFLPSFRKKLDKGAIVISVYLFKTLPKQVAKIFHYVIIHITDLSISALLRIVRFVDSRLHRFVHAVRGRKEVHKKEPSNGYLKDVHNHKAEVSKTIEELVEEDK
jgi:hypothetical protein